MAVPQQIQLFTDEVFEQTEPKHHNDTIEPKTMPVHEDLILNDRVIPLMKAAGLNLSGLKVCVRDIHSHWILVEVSTNTSNAAMTIFNNGESDYIHWISNEKTKEFEKHYFYNRYNPGKLFYLEKGLEKQASIFSCNKNK